MTAGNTESFKAHHVPTEIKNREVVVTPSPDHCQCSIENRHLIITTRTCIEIRVFYSNHHERYLYLNTKMRHTNIFSYPTYMTHLQENYNNNK